METAKQLLSLGYTPILVEKSNTLGGHVAKWYKLFPDMTPATEIIEPLKRDIASANIFTGTKVQSLNAGKDSYDIVLDNGISIEAKAVVFTTGFSLFDATRKEEYGYGVYDHVITNADLEAWFCGNEDKRICADPKAIGFVHCVGSRDLKAGNARCSKVCCTTAIKQAIEVKEKFPEAEIYCFYMDLRLFGKKYEDFYINAQRNYGVHFIRGRVSEVGETIDGRLQVKAEDTLSGKPLKVQLDTLVLMSGMACNEAVRNLAQQARLDVDDDGFLKSSNNIYGILNSNRKGIFYAGASTGTKTVPETLAEARAVAVEVHNYLKNG